MLFKRNQTRTSCHLIFAAPYQEIQRSALMLLNYSLQLRSIYSVQRVIAFVVADHKVKERLYSCF